MCRKHIRLLGILSFMGVLTLMVAGSPRVFASTTDGVIDATNRYAWSENIGWVDFGTTAGNVHVTDSALTGYAWNETTGWISLNCSNDTSCGTVDYKVTNTSAGTLGGNAWGENVGWIQFAPTNGGVTIDSSGNFSGYAWGENVGWIVFNCSNQTSCGTVSYKVANDWIPLSARPSSSSSSSSATAAPVQQSGGHRGSTQGMAERIAAAREQILARYSKTVIATAAHSSSSSSSSRNTGRDRSSPPVTTPPIIAAPSSPPLSILASIAKRRGLLLARLPDRDVIYRDVPVDAWFAPYVATLVDEGIAQGYRNTEGELTGQFGVQNPVTYAELLKMALEAAKIPVTGLPPPRNQSARGTWAASYVAVAEARTIPVINPALDVHHPATRAEVVAILLSVLNLPVASGQSPSFSDVPAGHRYAGAIATAAFYGLVQGNPDGTFRPDEPINRAEAAKLVALTKELMK